MLFLTPSQQRQCTEGICRYLLTETKPASRNCSYNKLQRCNASASEVTTLRRYANTFNIIIIIIIIINIIIIFTPGSIDVKN